MSTQDDRVHDCARVTAQHVAKAMLADVERIAQVIHDQELQAIPELNQDATINAETFASNRANIARLLTIVAGGENGSAAYDSPPEAFDIGRTFARRGINAELLFLAYWHGQNTALKEFMSFLQAIGSDNATVNIEALAIYVDISTKYGDHVIGEVMNAEREEREATSFGAHAARNDIVRLILDGAPIDIERSSMEMNYELNRYHTALVLWNDERPTEQGSFEDLVVTASKNLDERNPILIPSGASAAWAWIGSDHDDIMHHLKETLNPYPRQGHIAVGPTRYGIQGFRTSHTACLEMQRMFSGRSMAPGIAWYRDFAVSALIGQDSQRVTDFIHDTLGALAADSNRAARLRETLRIYLAEASNAPRTADRLHTHRNTIRQRVESATELLGYDPEQHRLAVELALKLSHQFGLGA